MHNSLILSITSRFSRRNTFGFTFQDVRREFSENNSIYLSRILAKMVREGMLLKIGRNNYHIIPSDVDPLIYIPDSIQLAKHFMQDREHYIGYASALRIHGLRLQINKTAPGKEYIVTLKQMRPSNRNIGGTSYYFVQHCSSRLYGCENLWVNRHEQVMVSNLEKTIVDIATKPRFCKGIVEVGNALYQSRKRVNPDRLFQYLLSNKNKSARKRILYLTDLLSLKWTRDHDMMMEELGTGISLLDPSAPEMGQILYKYGLKINVDPNSIRDIILSRK